MKPKVSVIIPSYNHGKFIIQALDSITNQTYENIQIIVVDDGSVDASCTHIENHKINSNKEFIFIKQENQGAHAAINRGLQLSDGAYLTILNSDDEYDPNRIQSFVEQAIKFDNQAIVTSYINVVDQSGKSLGIKEAYKNMYPWKVKNPEKTFLNKSNLKLNLVQFNYISTTSNLFLPRHVYEKIGNFHPLRYAHDWDYFLRISKQFNISVVEEPLLKYRLHQTNTINENQARMIFEICWVLAENVPSVIGSVLTTLDKPENIVDLWNRLFNSIDVLKCEKILLNLLFFKYALQADCIDTHRYLDSPLNFLDFLDPKNEIHQSSILEIRKILNTKRHPKNKILAKVREKWNLLKYR